MGVQLTCSSPVVFHIFLFSFHHSQVAASRLISIPGRGVDLSRQELITMVSTHHTLTNHDTNSNHYTLYTIATARCSCMKNAIFHKVVLVEGSVETQHQKPLRPWQLCEIMPTVVWRKDFTILNAVGWNEQYTLYKCCNIPWFLSQMGAPEHVQPWTD